MKQKRTVSVFIILCMLLSVMSASMNIASASSEAWQSLQAAISAGGTVDAR